ncbi:2-methylcitrate dehydratase PrpD [Polychaeton citri CBS 116435]|uniref:2-methylcitrate dehydratase PrpD n=1 Tax=Polychaeton citri CBS 116435 TaxID=1314669 RepID=A0A9P4QCZ5_9PEZI|nr:2-methylcitrate dehydratase PrpD [Polychaeton citri CBS 116435]
MADHTSSKPDGVTGRLCNWIHDTDLDSIPPQILERAKYLILDGVACMLVGAHLPWSETAVNAVSKMESAGPCTVVGWGGKSLSPPSAALLNSTFTQGFELDDIHSRAPMHANSLVIPPLLAAAEFALSTGESSTISGRDFLKAYVVGCEVGPRVGLALHGHDLLTRGWHSGTLQGHPAAAAAVASLLQFAPAQTESALGIACTQACGLMSAQYGSMAKRMQHGFAARNGLFGALMAREGYTGIQEVFEVPYGGFLSCFSQGANFEPKSKVDEITKGLGSDWELEGIRVKLHAAMVALHGPIDSIEKLQQEHPELLTTENLQKIESIETKHSHAAYEHGGWIAPPDQPLTSVAAQMSIQYAVAAQLVDRQVWTEQFRESNLNRPILREIMAKVHPAHDQSLDASADTKWGTSSKIRFIDGQEIETSVAAPKGFSPPASGDDIVQKWRSLTYGIIDEDRRDKIEQCILGLDTLGSIKTLAELLRDTVRSPI